jgi:hypothetical protein
MDPTRLPHKFLTAWVSHPQWSGGQHYTLRNSYVETLQHILPNIPDNGTIDSWLPLAQNREQWKTLGTEWIKHRQALTIYQYGPHPLLGDGILDHQFLWYLQDIYHLFSMNGGHVWSIFLCSFYYVMVLLLFWGHEPCIRFFLWRFNMPDALICYPGSIEKFKLLGVTYLLTYLLIIYRYYYCSRKPVCLRTTSLSMFSSYVLKMAKRRPRMGINRTLKAHASSVL